MATYPSQICEIGGDDHPSRLQAFACFSLLGDLSVDFGPIRSQDLMQQPSVPTSARLNVLPNALDREQLFKDMQRMVFETAVSLVLHESPDNPKAYISQSLMREVSRSSASSPVVKNIFEVVPQVAARTREFRLLADQVVPEFIQEAEKDGSKSFTIARIMASDPMVAYAGGEHTQQEELLALLWSVHATQNNEPDAHKISLTKLRQHIFDEFIAAEVLTEAVAGLDERDSVNDNANNLKQFVHALMESFNMDEKAAIAGMASTKGFSLWLPGTFEAVDERRGAYSDQIERYARIRHSFLRNTHIILPRTNMNRFRQQLTTLDKLIPGSSSSQRKNPTRAAVVAARATKRQHSRTDVSDNRVQSANESPEKNNPINRKLRYVNHVGAQFEEGSNEFQRFVEKYISEHDGDGFRKPDIESALNFLRTLDLSKRTVPGVIQLKGQRLNYSSTGEKLPVYELKPKEAGSLVETKSKHGDKVRIDFVVLPDGEVAIVKIYDRARVDVTSRKKIQNKYKPSNHSSCVAVDK